MQNLQARIPLDLGNADDMFAMPYENAGVRRKMVARKTRNAHRDVQGSKGKNDGREKHK
jgi:hypothetical protein